MNVVERNNVTIQGHGNRTLLFAHGYGCDKTIWRRVAPSFEKDYAVILFDHVGSGQSDLSQYNRTKYGNLRGYSKDLIEIGETLGLRNIIFVGHSVSTMIGLLASIQSPEFFERMILISPSPCYFNDGDYHGGFSHDAINQMLQVAESNFETWAKAMAPIIMGNSDRPELAQELVEIFCSTPPEIARHFAQVTFCSDNRNDLPKVRAPSLILQCTQDSIAPESVGRYLAQHLPLSKLRIMKATGHCPHVSAPDETIEGIREYLEQSIP